MNLLYKWLESKNYFTRTKETPIPSHLLYDSYNGGKVYIPREKEYEFLSSYAFSFANNEKLYFVETRPKTFKFMVDIDISDDHYWSTDEIVRLVANIQGTVLAFFDTDKATICCTSPVKIKEDGTHTGIHLIWPNIFVTNDTALCIRGGIIQKLKESDIKLSKLWEDVIDETIYTRNGYRMVGSDKISVDKVSKKKTIENRPLSLLFVMDSDGELSEPYYNRLKNNPKSLILETSIRYVIDTYLDHGMEPAKYPDWLEEDLIQKKAKSSGHGIGKLVSSKDHLIIEQFIRKNLPKVYSHQVVKAVTRYPDGNLLIKTNTRYCMNIGRNHNSCGIYFFASTTGVYQKCLCSCNKMEGRRKGLCMDYTSDCYPFDDETKKILFPESEKNLFEEEEKKKEFAKKKKKEREEKLKEERKYVPQTPANIKKERQKLCDKLFQDIVGTKNH
jgi:hypothetical protein